MLLKQGTDRTAAIDRQLACTLAGVAGALNATAFYVVGFFSANMTGNVSALSNHLALCDWPMAGFYAFIVAMFIFGAIASTIIINAGRRQGKQGIYAFVILLEALLLVILGGVPFWMPIAWRVPAIVWGLAFLMGLQNAVVTRISNARVRTTHVSGMVTDIGIELAVLFDIARGREPSGDGKNVHSNLMLHIATVLSFLFGGIVGLIVYRVTGGLTMWVAAAVLCLIAFPAWKKAHASAASETLPPNSL